MSMPVNWALTGRPDPDLARVRRRLAEVQAEARQVVKILTAEQAIKAQRVVREAGRAKR